MKVCLAVTVMVVVAFAVPLALVVEETARDRAFAGAERQASAVGPVLALTRDRRALQRAVAITQAGAEGRIAVHVPAGSAGSDAAGDTSGGGREALRVGRSRAPRDRLAAARRLGRASTVEVEGG
ncbi:histidine kinase, partial [Streptomyces nanshensis]